MVSMELQPWRAVALLGKGGGRKRRGGSHVIVAYHRRSSQVSLQFDMASPKLIALFLTFAMAAAAVLQPSEAARMVQAQQAFKPMAAAGQQAAGKVPLGDQATGGVPVPCPSTTPLASMAIPWKGSWRWGTKLTSGTHMTMRGAIWSFHEALLW